MNRATLVVLTGLDGAGNPPSRVVWWNGSAPKDTMSHTPTAGIFPN